MPHTVLFDRTTHWEVIGDYSRSPRIAVLSKTQWQNEYATNLDFAAMRSSQPGSVADITPQGVGKWKKDWSGPYLPPSVRLAITSDAALDFDGVPVVDADGNASHTLTVKKVDQDGNDVNAGGESIRMLLSAGLPISDANPSLVNGRTNVTVGLTTHPCDVVVRAADPSKILKEGSLTIRFK